MGPICHRLPVFWTRLKWRFSEKQIRTKLTFFKIILCLSNKLLWDLEICSQHLKPTDKNKCVLCSIISIGRLIMSKMQRMWRSLLCVPKKHSSSLLPQFLYFVFACCECLQCTCRHIDEDVFLFFFNLLLFCLFAFVFLSCGALSSLCHRTIEPPEHWVTKYV